MQIRHNLVVWEKPSFRRGRCVLKTAHHFKGSENKVYDMWLRIGAAIAAMTGCAAACVLLWPQARDADAILAAQDDPIQLSDLQLNSALRNDPGLIAQNIEAALAAGDAELAKSLVDVAEAKGIPVSADLSRRVADAVVQE